MRRTSIVSLVLALAMALPLVGQAGTLEQACGAASEAIDCCPSSPSAGDCKVADCAGWSSALPVASFAGAPARRVSVAPEIPLARSVAPPGRAPDTTPPKSLV